MDVKNAVAHAKQHIIDLFAEENISNVGLEEVELDEADDVWKVTVGFSRPWDEPRNPLAALSQSNLPRRSYKLVLVSDETGQVLSVKNRELKS